MPVPEKPKTSDAPESAPTEPTTHREHHKTRTPMPGDITDLIASYAGDYSLFCTANKNSREASRHSHLGPFLLKHVLGALDVSVDMRSRESITVADIKQIEKKKKHKETLINMLRRYPDFIHYRGDVTDSAAHQHKDVNAFELALALPQHVNLALEIFQVLHDGYRDELNDAMTGSLRSLSSFFCECIAKGEQKAAEEMLKRCPELLSFQGSFTDYSDRTFNCHPYLYAYWAKDTHMCRMLEKYMDETVKAEMLKRIDEIERDGLTYTQSGKTCCSSHFDFNPVINAIKAYVDGFDALRAARNEKAIITAWLKVGLAQRDVPAHVAQEWCNIGCRYDKTLYSRELTFLTYHVHGSRSKTVQEFWFPLKPSSGLGFDFAVTMRESGLQYGGAWVDKEDAQIDLKLVTELDRLKDIAIKLTREKLQPSESSPEQGKRI